MLPTRPRVAARSISSSCTTPEPATATRVSCGVTLMRISSVTSELFEQLAGFVERQPHHAGVAAAQLDDEARRAPLDRVGAGLVVAFPGGRVLGNLPRGKRLESYLGARHRAFHPVLLLERDRRENLVRAAGEGGGHRGSPVPPDGLSQDAPVQP